MSRPRALVSMRVTEEEIYVEPRSALAHDYVAWLERLGWSVIPVPAVTSAVEEYLSIPGVGVVVLTGGNNVDPLLYGAERGEIKQIYPERDRCEYALLDGALSRGVPIWGTCRGMHTINVYFGGTLTPRIVDHVATTHRLNSPLPFLDGVETNSYHNQGVLPVNLASPLVSLAGTADGAVEACYHPSARIVGVQWHPERQRSTIDDELFISLVCGSLSPDWPAPQQTTTRSTP